MKTEGKCNESVKNEFKIIRESNSLHQMEQSHWKFIAHFITITMVTTIL